MKLNLLARLRAGFADPLPLPEAKQRWRDVRVSVGLLPSAPRLLTRPSGNTKLAKGGQYGLSLLPARLSGTNLCAYSTPGCRTACLNTAGRGWMPYVQEGRLARSRFLVEQPSAFATILMREVLNLPQDAAVRLNLLSDILWENVFPQLFERLADERPDIQVYDYTKYPIGSRNPPTNLHLTYSASENWTVDQISEAITFGNNVAVPFHLRRSDPMPKEWNGMPVIDGDISDSRYDDPSGVIVGLRAKGKAVGSASSFVRQPVDTR